MEEISNKIKSGLQFKVKSRKFWLQKKLLIKVTILGIKFHAKKPLIFKRKKCTVSNYVSLFSRPYVGCFKNCVTYDIKSLFKPSCTLN